MGKSSTRKSRSNWGFDLTGINSNVDPQDDFFHYANGGWINRTNIPDDESEWDSFEILARENRQRLMVILEELSAQKDLVPGSDGQKLRDFYTSGMDMAKRNRERASSLGADMARITSINTIEDLTPAIARLHLINADSLWSLDVAQDPKDSQTMALFLFQGGLGLPDREYYLAEDKEEIRQQYINHIKRILSLLGYDVQTAEFAVCSIFDIEMELAKVSWESYRLRNISAQCNYLSIEGLIDICPAIDWRKYFEICGVDIAKPIIVGQLKFVAKIDELLKRIPLDAWREYFRWNLICATVSFLSQDFVDENFSFFGTKLSGQQMLKPLKDRCVIDTNSFLGMALGRFYVQRHFPPKAKKKIQNLCDYIVAACEDRIRRLEWMNETTKNKAIGKLRAITWKLGYPDRWRDYEALDIGTDSYILNVLRVQEFEARRQLVQVGKSVDRDEWHMSPQTINAYANFMLVEMVFPAGILQWPFFDPEVDDAINYGAIGSVIAHELSHHFDDQGSQFDAQGNLNNWWTSEDRVAFEKRGARLVEQFDGYTILGKNVNGKLTLGENISDLGGVQIAFEAYQKTLHGKQQSVINGFTPARRFFLGFAQMWRGKARDELIMQRLVTNTHAPAQFRINGPLSNIAAFYESFDVQEGDRMYRKPQERVEIW